MEHTYHDLREMTVAQLREVAGTLTGTTPLSKAIFD